MIVSFSVNLSPLTTRRSCSGPGKFVQDCNTADLSLLEKGSIESMSSEQGVDEAPIIRRKTGLRARSKVDSTLSPYHRQEPVPPSLESVRSTNESRMACLSGSLPNCPRQIHIKAMIPTFANDPSRFREEKAIRHALG